MECAKKILDGTKTFSLIVSSANLLYNNHFHLNEVALHINIFCRLMKLLGITAANWLATF